jgi:hypothetical protein
MISIQQAIYEIITGNTVLNALLPGGVSSVWTPGNLYPRLIMNISMSRIDNEIQGGNAGFDLYVHGNNQYLTENIRTRLEYLLEKEVIETDETGNTLRMNKLSHAYIPDENPEILHCSIQYDMRAARIRPAEGD